MYVVPFLVYSAINNGVTLKSGLGVIQCYCSGAVQQTSYWSACGTCLSIARYHCDSWASSFETQCRRLTDSMAKTFCKRLQLAINCGKMQRKPTYCTYNNNNKVITSTTVLCHNLITIIGYILRFVNGKYRKKTSHRLTQQNDIELRFFSKW